MLIIIVIVAIALILIIPSKKKSGKDDFSYGNETLKPNQKTSFLTVIGYWLRNITKGK